MKQRIKCGTCSAISDARFSRSFLGLRYFTCPSCKAKHAFGLSRSTKILYFFFVALLVYAMYIGIARPGILVFIVGYAFYKDKEIKNSYATAHFVRPNDGI